MRDPKAILAHDGIRAAGFDPDPPACVVLACVLHFVDAETAQGIAGTFVQALAPGSYVLIPGAGGQGWAGTWSKPICGGVAMRRSGRGRPWPCPPARQA